LGRFFDLWQLAKTVMVRQRCRARSAWRRPGRRSDRLGSQSVLQSLLQSVLRLPIPLQLFIPAVRIPVLWRLLGKNRKRRPLALAEFATPAAMMAVVMAMTPILRIGRSRRRRGEGNDRDNCGHHSQTTHRLSCDLVRDHVGSPSDRCRPAIPVKWRVFPPTSVKTITGSTDFLLPRPLAGLTLRVKSVRSCRSANNAGGVEQIGCARWPARTIRKPPGLLSKWPIRLAI
jgi:hypothetical protein